MLQYRAKTPEADSAVSPRAHRFKWLAIPSGLAAAVVALFPFQGAKSVIGDLALNVAAEVVAPELPKLFANLGIAAAYSQDPAAQRRAEEQVGLAFAKELVRNHRYWCDPEELDQSCIERLSKLASEDFKATLIHWYQSVEACRESAAHSSTNPHSDEIKMHEEFFACMVRRGYARQIAALRALE